MNQIVQHKVSRPGSTEAVKFVDGMLVTAEDLNAATHYPLAVMQVLLRSYMGCGIVCGLRVTRAEDVKTDPGRTEPNFAVDIERGVALGCDGYPVELCKSVRLDFPPEPCAAATKEPSVRYIAMRRVTASEMPPRACGCGSAGGDPGKQCTRVADHAIVQAFDEEHLPKGICRQPPAQEANPAVSATAESLCQCLSNCPDCDRCAEPWILLATVMVNADGVIAGRVNAADDVRDRGGPRPIKPIACLCDAERRGQGRSDATDERVKGLTTDLAALSERVKKLERPAKGNVASSGGAGAPVEAAGSVATAGSDATNASQT
ncbi:MAG: hypothetical protein QOE79_5 [Sphingomonadales bacterium]|nr:hypothetical protein [Sphingomonadales bacterium]